MLATGLAEGSCEDGQADRVVVNVLRKNKTPQTRSSRGTYVDQPSPSAAQLGRYGMARIW